MGRDGKELFFFVGSWVYMTTVWKRGDRGFCVAALVPCVVNLLDKSRLLMVCIGDIIDSLLSWCARERRVK